MVRCQEISRVDLFAQGVVADRDFWGVGAGLGLKGKGRTAVRAAMSGGTFGHRGAVRAEILADFRLTSRLKRGVGAYVGAGVALTSSTAATKEYIVLLVGLEAQRTGSRSWYWEVGVAGGWRFTAGYRFNR